MKYPPIALILIITAAVTLPLRAGNLDKAPFQIIAPNADWKLDESTSTKIGKDVSFVATLSNPKTRVISKVLKAGPFPPSTSASVFDDSVAGFRGTLAKPGVKMIADNDSTFLGYKCRLFAYEAPGQVVKLTYGETVVFIVDDTVWAIIFSGPIDQKAAINQMVTSFRKRTTLSERLRAVTRADRNLSFCPLAPKVRLWERKPAGQLRCAGWWTAPLRMTTGGEFALPIGVIRPT